VPHGVTVGLLLPYVMECNLPANLPKYATIAQMLGVKTQGLSLQKAAEKGVEAYKALAKDIGIPLHLRDLGVPKEALEELAVATMDVTRLLANNPKKLTLDDVRRIWQNAW
jgi:alcohol dehydrogenase class IV